MSHNYPGFGGRGKIYSIARKKFQSKEAHLPDGILAQDLGGDWRGLAGIRLEDAGDGAGMVKCTT